MEKNDAKDLKINDQRVRITDTTFRDAHQSLLATRMRTEDLLPIAEKMDEIGFWSMEVWGGATFDTCLRYLKEDPWDRLRAIKKVLKKTKLQMLLRGQNLLGYRHYSDDVLTKFIEKSVDNGMDVFRIFDAMNDVRNMEKAIHTVKKYGAIAEGAISYTTSPVHTHEGFVEMAIKLEQFGCDTICVKDMAGLLSPNNASDLIGKIRAKIKLPIHMHTHETSGMGSMSYLKAIEAGCNIIDTAISPLASGTSQPATEPMVAALGETSHSTQLNLAQLDEVADYFRKVRKKYKKYESEFTGINTKVLISQVPGGMISNMASQLKEQGALDRMDEVMLEVPKVREDFGFPPLVTPTSQIVGTQATLNVLTGERYKVITSETKNYLKGLYGKSPAPINEKVRKKAIGDEIPITCRPADLLEPEMEKLTRELGGKAKGIEDVLTYALFPNVALEFFGAREQGKLEPEPLDVVADVAAPKIEMQHLAPSEFKITVHGETFHIKVAGTGHKSEDVRPFFLKVDGKMEEVMVQSLVEVVPSSDGVIDSNINSFHSSRPKAVKKGHITTAMPGRVVNIKVSEGEQVKAGDTLCIVEAMKMENEVYSPMDGTVKKIYIKESDNVNPDETLMEIE
ncbi:MAG: sodium-extruding oxaloacetate decarboxylase subunit alpha [Spirochaetia bacterium]|nr:sodium-extruding oxaloacetate decarboxylase subunit alpha [Spirochaetia bacterium]